MVLLQGALQELEAYVKVGGRERRQAREDLIGPSELHLVKENIHDAQFLEGIILRVLWELERCKALAEIYQELGYLS